MDLRLFYFDVANCEIMKDLNSICFLPAEVYFAILDNARSS